MCDRKFHGCFGIRNQRGITKGHEKNFRCDGYTHCLDLVMVSWVYTYVKTSNCTLLICACQLYINHTYFNKAINNVYGI